MDEQQTSDKADMLWFQDANRFLAEKQREDAQRKLEQEERMKAEQRERWIGMWNELKQALLNVVGKEAMLQLTSGRTIPEVVMEIDAGNDYFFRWQPPQRFMDGEMHPMLKLGIRLPDNLKNYLDEYEGRDCLIADSIAKPGDLVRALGWLNEQYIELNANYAKLMAQRSISLQQEFAQAAKDAISDPRPVEPELDTAALGYIDYLESTIHRIKTGMALNRSQKHILDEIDLMRWLMGDDE